MKFGYMALIVLCAVLGASSTAQSADMTEPVREVMQAAASNWVEGGADEPQDVFSEDRLDRIFSEDFAESFRAASLNPAFGLEDGETTGFPFDYDPIAQGQDGCPFENIRFEDNGNGEVTVSFQNRNCFGEADGKGKDTVLIFEVEMEDGRAVIDDIVPLSMEGEPKNTIKDDLRVIAGQ